MNEKKAKEILTAATGDEGDMVHCFEVNAYSSEIPQGNEAKRIELVRLALACLDECQTCGGSKEVRKILGHIKGMPLRDYVGSKISCQTCKDSRKVGVPAEVSNYGTPIGQDSEDCSDCQPKPEPCRGLVEQIERILSTYFDSVPLDEIRLLLSRLRSPTPESPSTSSGQASREFVKEARDCLVNLRSGATLIGEQHYSQWIEEATTYIEFLQKELEAENKHLHLRELMQEQLDDETARNWMACHLIREFKQALKETNANQK